MYEFYAQKKPGLSTDPHTNRPGGPFFRLVRAVLVLCGEHGKSDAAVASAIKRTLRRDLAKRISIRGKSRTTSL